MSKPTNVSPDEERDVMDIFTTGVQILKDNPGALDKIVDMFRSTRDISPNEERELSALAKKLKGDAMQRSRDLPSGNVSPDQQRWVPLLIGAASTVMQLAKDNPGAVSKVKSFVSGLFD